MSGGGILASASVIELSEVQVSDCCAGQFGGALYIALDSTLNVANASIVDNEAAESGGGIFATLSRVNLSGPGVEIARCVAANSGGGVDLSASTLVAANVSIVGNEAGIGGGICARWSSVVDLNWVS
eukprot:2681676-Rhodomonas_salina.1